MSSDSLEACSRPSPRWERSDGTIYEGGKETAAPVENEDVHVDTSAAWSVEDGKYGRVGFLQSREALLRAGKLLPDPAPNRLKMLYIKRPSESQAGIGKKKKSGKVLRNIEGLGATARSTQCGDIGAVWQVKNGDFDSVWVRSDIDMRSTILREIKQGTEVTQKGWAEVFVDGDAKGLVRMPIKPDGWVTVDATELGGPIYLELIEEGPIFDSPKTSKKGDGKGQKGKGKERMQESPSETPSLSPRSDAEVGAARVGGSTVVSPPSGKMWEVIFKSGAAKADIIVRELADIASQEVCFLFQGDVVEQNGDVFMSPEKVPRLPIKTALGNTGWVTLDASARGGPAFLAPATNEAKIAKFCEERLQVTGRPPSSPPLSPTSSTVKVKGKQQDKNKGNKDVGKSGKESTKDVGKGGKESARDAGKGNKEASKGGKDSGKVESSHTVEKRSSGIYVTTTVTNYPLSDEEHSPMPSPATDRRSKASKKTDKTTSRGGSILPNDQVPPRDGPSRVERNKTREYAKTKLWKIVVDDPIPVMVDSGVTDAIAFLKGKGTIVAQAGHTKKQRGHLLMPITCDDPPITGWVTRRQMGGKEYFQAVEGEEALEYQEARKSEATNVQETVA